MLVNKQQAPSESKAWQKKTQPENNPGKKKNNTPWNSLPGGEGGERTQRPEPLNLWREKFYHHLGRSCGLPQA